MKRPALFVLLLTLAGVAPGQAQDTSNPSAVIVSGPRPGARAPEFSLPWTSADSAGSEASVFQLAEQRGRVVILAFLPRAWTATTTRELRQFAERRDSLLGDQAIVVGLTPDPGATNHDYARSIGTPFRILSDPDQAVARRYGSRADGGYNRRTVYVIGYTGDVVYRDLRFDPDAASSWHALERAVREARAGG
jgi:peroxiredoxin Q/BCP